MNLDIVLEFKWRTYSEAKMDKAKFIQQHLIEKGVPADLTRPTAFIWSKYRDLSKKPLVFGV